MTWMLFAAVTLYAYLAALPPNVDRAVFWIILFFGTLALLGALGELLWRHEVLLDTATGGELIARSGFWFAPKSARYPLEHFNRVLLVEKGDDRRHRWSTLYLVAPKRTLLVLTTPMEDDEHAFRIVARIAAHTGLPLEEQRVGAAPRWIASAELARHAPKPGTGDERPLWTQPAALVLLATNIVPLAGVLFLHWDLVTLMLVFWLDNLVLGGYAVGRILLARLARQTASGRASPGRRIAGALYFVAKYGSLALFHGAFIIFFFGDLARRMADQPVPDLAIYVPQVLSRPELAVIAVALAISRGMDFFDHYLRPRAFEKAYVEDEVSTPFGRVILLHIVIAFGGLLAYLLHAPIIPLVMLILLKTTADLFSYIDRNRPRHGTGFDALAAAQPGS